MLFWYDSTNEATGNLIEFWFDQKMSHSFCSNLTCFAAISQVHMFNDIIFSIVSMMIIAMAIMSFGSLRYVSKYTCLRISSVAFQWRHNEGDGVSNHQPHHCLPNRLFRRRSRKTSKFRVTGLCVGNSPLTRKMFPFDDIIMGRVITCTS